jgi:acetyl-CoA acetyltransferase family protein
MYNISREDQDAFAARSQQKAASAREGGRLAKEIVPISIPRRKSDPVVFDQDEYIRPDTTPEVLAKLKPVFREGGSVTAGNASGINDGAVALVLGSAAAANDYDLKPRGRLVAGAAVGVEPRIMGMGPVEATRKVMRMSGMTLEQMDVIELNEAFASQSLACLRELGLDDDDERVNPNGGAIAIGHPLGMSGGRLLTTALTELEQRNKRFALCTMCVGVGQGVATIIERV